MKILITNDDGIQGKGLTPLLNKVKAITDDWKVIVPDRERSAVSQAITLKSPIRMKKVKTNVFKIDGTPTDCVYLTVLGAMDFSPNIVISGINKGPNLSEDIVYSGTVAAAIEACLANIKSFAISIDALKGKIYYETAAEIAAGFASQLSKMKVPNGIFFNINVPNLPKEKIKGIKATKLGTRRYLDKLIKRKDPAGNPYFWLSGDDVLWKDEKGTDYHEVKRGYVSITPLHLDLTAYEFIPKMESIISKM
ncbi:MAG: 5'/3'-nucleotidase SurE [Spirochaetes bacterium]|nr:5'/3'-nucleotidase SurE [Spirochaetota bacterium]